MTTTTQPRRRRGERGIALVITMFLMASLSALAVSLMFLSNTETAATRNYRTMSQARYGGEAAVHAAMNYLMSSSYSLPASPFTGYGITQSPVTCTAGCTHTTASSCDATSAATAINTGCIVLVGGMSGLASNYPNATVAAGFSAAAQGTLATNSAGVTNNAALGTVKYGAAAILLSMQQVTVYGGGTTVLQTWQVVGDGTVPSPIPATVEVMATVERGLTNSEMFAVFASDDGCGAITMAGDETTDSYDSSAALSGGGTPVISMSGGGVGTNGNLDLSGHVTVNGTLTTPRTGVGACSSGTVTAETTTGNATVTDGTISLPQAKTWSDPPAPSPMPGTTSLAINSSTTVLQCQAALAQSPGAICTGAGGSFTITANGVPLVLPNVTLSGGGTLTIAGGSSSTVNLNVNSFTMSGNSTLALSSGTSVVMNLAGQGIDASGTVLDFTGGALSSGSYDPSKFQILYAGDGHMEMTGNSGSSTMVYAPDAQFTMHGTTDFYGSVLANKFTDTGGATVHYDRSLSSKFQSLGNFVLTSFTWKKY